MTRDELWAAYVKRNPTFAGTGQVTMSASGLKKLFDETWKHAHARGVTTGRANDIPADNPISELFKRFK